MVEILTEREQEALVMAFQGPFTEAELERAFEWAEWVRINTVMLDLVLDGSIKIMVDAEGELLFSFPKADVEDVE